jgi:ADP-ribose pyrophosphatase
MKILKEEELYKGYLKINQLTLENKGKEFTRDWVQSKDAVAAIVYDETLHQYVFVKQFRVGPKEEIVELVAGLIENGLTPMETMIHEVEEEIGYNVDTIDVLCEFYTTPGKTNEKIYLFYVTVSKQFSKGGGLDSENEDIEVVKVYQNDIKTLNIVDGKTLIGLYKLDLLR